MSRNMSNPVGALAQQLEQTHVRYDHQESSLVT